MVIPRLHIAAAAAAALMCGSLNACGGDGSGPRQSTARIDYVAGAIEPILSHGEHFIVEGFGFGDARGSGGLQLRGPADVVVEIAVPDSEWSQLAIGGTVPDGAALGVNTLMLTTASGRQLVATVHILPAPSFDPAALSWVSRALFPRAPAGIALAAAEFPGVTGWRTTLYAAGGAEPLASGGELQLLPDSGVYIARAVAGGAGAVDAWIRQRDTSEAARSRVLPVPRAFAAAVLATPHNSRLPGSALYVIGGIDVSGRAQASVLGADVTADSVSSRFVFLETLPTPVAGAIAVVRRGRIYVMGGTDAQGRPQRNVYVGRIGADGHIDGWYAQPQLPAPRAYGGGFARETRLLAVGGVADSVPPGGGFSAGTTRFVTGDTASLSRMSGFFTGLWGTGPTLLPDGRSQFALLDLGPQVLIVGGMYTGAASNSAETIAASVSGDSVGPFAGPVGQNSIAGLMCLSQPAGPLVGPSGVTWREEDGTTRGLVVGGIDLATLVRRTCAWGF